MFNSLMARRWQDAQVGFTAGARENGRPRSSPRPGDIRIHLQQQQENGTQTSPKLFSQVEHCNFVSVTNVR